MEMRNELCPVGEMRAYVRRCLRLARAVGRREGIKYLTRQLQEESKEDRLTLEGGSIEDTDVRSEDPHRG